MNSPAQTPQPSSASPTTKKGQKKKALRICLFFIPIRQNNEGQIRIYFFFTLLISICACIFAVVVSSHSGPFGLIGFIISVMTFVTGTITFFRLKTILKDQEDDSVESFMPIKW